MFVPEVTNCSWWIVLVYPSHCQQSNLRTRMDLRYPPWFSVYTIIAVFVNRLHTNWCEFFLPYMDRNALRGGVRPVRRKHNVKPKSWICRYVRNLWVCYQLNCERDRRPNGQPIAKELPWLRCFGEFKAELVETRAYGKIVPKLNTITFSFTSNNWCIE